VSDAVSLTDLDVISQYSLALRSGEADRDELIELLESDLAWLRSTAPSTPPAKAAGSRGRGRAPGGATRSREA
jgi:hypothetical protein